MSSIGTACHVCRRTRVSGARQSSHPGLTFRAAGDGIPGRACRSVVAPCPLDRAVVAHHGLRSYCAIESASLGTSIPSDSHLLASAMNGAAVGQPAAATNLRTRDVMGPPHNATAATDFWPCTASFAQVGDGIHPSLKPGPPVGGTPISDLRPLLLHFETCAVTGLPLGVAKWRLTWGLAVWHGFDRRYVTLCKGI